MNETLDLSLSTLQLEQGNITDSESQLQQKQNQEEIGQKFIKPYDNSFANIDTRLAGRSKSNIKRPKKPEKKKVTELYEHWRLEEILRYETPTLASFLPLAGVYFITYKGDEEKVKIGKGKCVYRRIRTYLTTHYREIKVLCIIQSMVGLEGALERELHNYFAECRYTREWFDFDEHLKSGIERIKQLNSFQPYVITRTGSEVYEATN